MFLINNNSVSNIDNIIEKEINLLIENGYIKNEFKLKCLYLIPNIASYNLKNVQEEINNLKENNNSLNKEIEKLKTEVDRKMKASLEEFKGIVDQLISSHNKEKTKMMSDHDFLLFKYNELKKQNSK